MLRLRQSPNPNGASKKTINKMSETYQYSKIKKKKEFILQNQDPMYVYICILLDINIIININICI